MTQTRLRAPWQQRALCCSMTLSCFLLRGVLFTVLCSGTAGGPGGGGGGGGAEILLEAVPRRQLCWNPRKGSFRLSIHNSNRKSHSLSLPSQRTTTTKLFSRPKGEKHNTESKGKRQGRDVNRCSPLFRVPGCIVLFR